MMHSEETTHHSSSSIPEDDCDESSLLSSIDLGGEKSNLNREEDYDLTEYYEEQMVRREKRNEDILSVSDNSPPPSSDERGEMKGSIENIFPLVQYPTLRDNRVDDLRTGNPLAVSAIPQAAPPLLIDNYRRFYNSKKAEDLIDTGVELLSGLGSARREEFARSEATILSGRSDDSLHLDENPDDTLSERLRKIDCTKRIDTVTLESDKDFKNCSREDEKCLSTNHDDDSSEADQVSVEFVQKNSSFTNQYRRSLQILKIFFFLIVVTTLLFDNIRWRRRALHLQEEVNDVKLVNGKLIKMREQMRRAMRKLHDDVQIFKEREKDWIKEKERWLKLEELGNMFFCNDETCKKDPSPFVNLDNCWFNAQASFQLGQCGSNIVNRLQSTAKIMGNGGSSTETNILRNIVDSVVDSASSLREAFSEQVGRSKSSEDNFDSGNITGSNSKNSSNLFESTDDAKNHLMEKEPLESNTCIFQSFMEGASDVFKSSSSLISSMMDRAKEATETNALDEYIKVCDW